MDLVRVVDHDIPAGVYPDMTGHGWPGDEWPAISKQVQAAHIIVERLYGNSSQLNEAG